jgi:hypothetical protein
MAEPSKDTRNIGALILHIRTELKKSCRCWVIAVQQILLSDLELVFEPLSTLSGLYSVSLNFVLRWYWCIRLSFRLLRTAFNRSLFYFT